MLHARRHLHVTAGILAALLIACDSSNSAPGVVTVGESRDGGPVHDGGSAMSHSDADTDGGMDAGTDAAHGGNTPTDAGELVDADFLATSRAPSWTSSCETLDPDRVYMLGPLAGIDGGSAIAAPADPTRVCPGFDRVTHLAIRPSDGAVIVAWDAFTSGSDTIPAAVSVRRADAFTFDFDEGHFISDPAFWENDTPLVTICPDSPVLPTYQDVRTTPTGKTTFTCNDNNYEFPGNELAEGYEVLAHGDDAHSVVRNELAPHQLGVWHDDVFTPLTMQWTGSVYHARARTGGFWLAVENGTGQAVQVKITLAGKATVVGPYAAPPATYGDAPGGVLDAEGVLWQILSDDDTERAVVMRPLQPMASSVVYSMKGRKPDMATRPPRAFVDLAGAKLFTGP